MPKLVAALGLALALALCAAEASAQGRPSPAAASPPARDQQDSTQEALNALNKVDELVALLQRQADTNRAQCLNAVGNSSFCDCISSRIPMAIDFLRYVAITAATKEQIKYDALSDDTKVIVDGAKRARDECVKQAFHH